MNTIEKTEKTETKNPQSGKNNNITTIININFLTPSNAEFSMTENGFLQLKATVPNPEKENAVESIEFDRVFLHRAFPFDMPYQYISVLGIFPKPEAKKEDKEESEKHTEKETEKNENEDDKKEEAKDDADKNKDKDKDKDKKEKDRENVTSVGELKEIGIISHINVFGELAQEALKTSLNNKYFTSVIELIYSIKDKYGYSYWDIKTNVGRVKFTVHDTYRSILKVTPDRVMINDINGNRYEIPSLAKFDKNSFRKIELFF